VRLWPRLDSQCRCESFDADRLSDAVAMLPDGPHHNPLPMNLTRARGLIDACHLPARTWPDGCHWHVFTVGVSLLTVVVFFSSPTPRTPTTAPVHGPPRSRSTLSRTSNFALNSCGDGDSRAPTTSPTLPATPHLLECGVELDAEVLPGATVSARFVVDEASGGRGVYRVSDCNTIRECLCEQPIDRLDGLAVRSFKLAWLASLAPQSGKPSCIQLPIKLREQLS